jgi:predicted SAM-dependent methyltransferase
VSGKPLRINLGSGEAYLEGFVNVDALPDAPGVDVVADISEELPFETGSADLIYAAHLLEHFPTDAVPGMLAEWRRVLKVGGQLLVAVPDIEAIAKIIAERRPGWFTPPHEPWIGAIYGGQKDEYDFHKTGFTAPWLAYLLNQAGFGAVKREERFQEINLRDASFSPLPFGTNISLNMRATAGQGPMVELGPDPGTRAFNLVDRALTTGLMVSTAARARVMERRRRRIESEMGWRQG